MYIICILFYVLLLSVSQIHKGSWRSSSHMLPSAILNIMLGFCFKEETDTKYIKYHCMEFQILHYSQGILMH